MPIWKTTNLVGLETAKEEKERKLKAPKNYSVYKWKKTA